MCLCPDVFRLAQTLRNQPGSLVGCLGAGPGGAGQRVQRYGFRVEDMTVWGRCRGLWVTAQPGNTGSRPVAVRGWQGAVSVTHDCQA